MGEGGAERTTRVPELGDHLRRGGLVAAALAAGGFGADYALNIGLSRLLDAHSYGDYRVAREFAAFAGVAVLLGGDRAAAKALAGPFGRRDLAAVWEYLRFYLGLAAGLSVAVIAIVWAAAFFHLGPSDPDDHHAIAWMAVGVPLVAGGALISRALQSAHRLALAGLPWRIGFPLLKLGLLAGWAFALGELTVHEAVVLALVATAAVTALQWLALVRLELPRLERAPSQRHPRQWLVTSMPMMGAFLVALGLGQSDLYFLEALGDEKEVGHYAAASTSAHFLVVVQATIVGLVATVLQPALDQGRAQALDVYRRSQRMLVLALVPSAVVLIVAARPILELFGSGFTDAVPVMNLLVLANLAWAVAALAMLWLQYTDRAGFVLAVTGVTLAVDSLLNLVLIPRFGMQGAAASTLISVSLAAAVIVWMRRRHADRAA
ncbi:MAG: oligosaccharide flippase family protein [Acidobacteriota bacterium]